MQILKEYVLLICLVSLSFNLRCLKSGRLEMLYYNENQ